MSGSEACLCCFWPAHAFPLDSQLPNMSCRDWTHETPVGSTPHSARSGFRAYYPSDERQISQHTIISTDNGRYPSRRYCQAGV
jgi:hypothetical protein